MSAPTATRPRAAFTVIELLVVIGIVGVLLALLLPAVERARHRTYIDKCANNLRQIGPAISIYENENHGNWPRTVYDPATADAPAKGTGVNAADPFTPGSAVRTNDLTAGLFLLLRAERLPPAVFVCPYNDATSYVADSANLAGRSNFTDQRKNLAYSFADPYPSASAAAAGYALNARLAANVPVGADKNPGRGEGTDDVYAVTVDSRARDMEEANSPNHEREGQNVLFADGHVTYVTTPFVGVGRDHIYTARDGTPPAVERSPTDATDTLLLPTDD